MKKSNTSNPILSNIMYLPTPWNISYNWNIGSFLGILLSLQMTSGLLLVFYYVPTEADAFNSVTFIFREIKFGFLMRYAHLNGASFLFMMMYAHLLKGLKNCSYSLSMSWLSGNLIMLLMVLVAFMGYVLPWGNMGFWAATVITSFISAVPILGDMILTWVWGGYSISGRTLQFFFTLHFLLPFMIAAIAVLHLLFLHLKGSSNQLGSHSPLLKIKFYPFFTSKDSLNMVLLLTATWFLMVYPYWSSDPENFTYANRLTSPINIQPEWYFLPFYAMLRSSDSKLGGLLLMIAGLSVFWGMPYFIWQDMKNIPVYNLILLLFSLAFILLGWVASWSADSYFAIWLNLLMVLYFASWGAIWFMAIMMHMIHD